MFSRILNWTQKREKPRHPKIPCDKATLLVTVKVKSLLTVNLYTDKYLHPKQQKKDP
jgi:hypothetical protein